MVCGYTSSLTTPLSSLLLGPCPPRGRICYNVNMHIRQIIQPWMITVWTFISRNAKHVARLFKRAFLGAVHFIARVVGAIWRFVKLIFAARSTIVGSLLLVGFLVTLTMTLNHFIGMQEYTLALQKWSADGNHWLMVAGAVSAVLLLTWNQMSPTLRTLFGDSWFKVAVWGMVGLALLGCALVGWPEATVAYRTGNLGCMILYLVAVGMVAKALPPRQMELEDSLYVEDNPKAHSKAVLYESQTQIVNDIRHLIAGAQPSTFAVSGRWGIGKTFLLQRAADQLADDETIIWVNFEPWRYASEEALIRGFYEDIGKKLAKDISGIQHIARPLAETTEKFVRKHDGSGIVGSILDMTRAAFSPPVKDTPEMQIGNLLKREGKRLVVVIDDVERSFSAERIFRALQLAHFAKGIENVQVVFVCDKDVVLKARPPHFGNPAQDATEYLEKFVEREVVVPGPRPPELRQLFSNLMQRQQGRQGFDFTESDLPDDMLDAIATPRAIIRLYNEFAAFRVNVDRNER